MAKKKKKLSKKHHFESNKLLIILLLFLTFVLLIVYASAKSKPRSISEKEIVGAVNSSMVKVPDTSFVVSLTDGKAEFSDSETQGNVSVSEPYYWVKTQDGYDVFSVMSYSTGGLEEFVNVALFQETKGKITYKGSFPIGDRVIVSGIEKESEGDGEYMIKVNYLDRAEEDLMSDAPSLEKSTSFEVISHQIVIPAPSQ